MKNLRDVIIDNLIWVITTLLVIGAYGATIKFQGDALAATSVQVADVQKRVDVAEKNIIRFEVIHEDIKEMKEDIKDIKRIVLKPAISENKISENEKIVSNNQK